MPSGWDSAMNVAMASSFIELSLSGSLLGVHHAFEVGAAASLLLIQLSVVILGEQLL